MKYQPGSIALTLPALALKLFNPCKVSARACVLDELRHSLSQIEILYGRDDRLPLGFCSGEAHCFRQVAVGNIHCGFHTFILANNRI